MEWSATKRGNKKPNNSCASGLKQLHWTEADLETRPKGDKGKVKLAQCVRKETIRACFKIQ
jgi:hypothetical protein